MLHGEWNSNDSYSKNQGQKEVCQGDPYTPDQDPDYIQKNWQAARGSGSIDRMCAERGKGKNCQFKTLNAKRNADDGYTHSDATENILNAEDDPSPENDPENIKQEVHG